jgi:ATP-dependent DNA helicase RecG
MRTVHLPPSTDALEAARRRLRFDEAFVPQVALAQRRYALRGASARPRPACKDGLVEELDARLPYRLTAAQVRVGELLEREMADVHPMHRLLQGDVGSGKTVVALRAMLGAVDAGGQAALLAPTEVLAHQHWRSITALLGPLGERGRLRFDDSGGPEGTSVALLTGSLSAAARRTALLDIASGAAGIVIGTHALLEDRVTFADLALVVIDEQHRFGVEQRAALAAKAVDGTRPHVLVMTATPIPRTVAMTVFGDLDTTALDEMPAGRQQISTHVVPTRDKPHYLDRVWVRVREEVEAGRRAYVVCPRIDASEGQESGGASVLELAETLRTGPLAGLRIGILHGRLGSDEKESVMAAFAADGPDALDVLVCTTVVEVGLDVAKASTMVVMDAERFGVSQLHQLRGRVGRGSDPGLCLLVTACEADSPARERIDGVAATTDGFALARLDLEQRREGDVLGRAQSGDSGFVFLDLLRDEEVIEAAHDEATRLVEADPGLTRHRPLAAVLAEIESRSEYLMKD